MRSETLQKLCTLGCILPVMTLGGCAQFQNHGQSLVHGAKKSVLHLLRPAPKQVEVFQSAVAVLERKPENTNAIGIDEHPITTTQPVFSIASKALEVPKTVPFVDYGGTPLTITLPEMKQDDWLAGAPSAPRKLSFVKLLGQTNARDIKLCALQAGGQFVRSLNGYEISPKFSICLNGKGYLSETLAIKIIEG